MPKASLELCLLLSYEIWWARLPMCVSEKAITTKGLCSWIVYLRTVIQIRAKGILLSALFWFIMQFSNWKPWQTQLYYEWTVVLFCYCSFDFILQAIYDKILSWDFLFSSSLFLVVATSLFIKYFLKIFWHVSGAYINAKYSRLWLACLFYILSYSLLIKDCRSMALNSQIFTVIALTCYFLNINCPSIII